MPEHLINRCLQQCPHGRGLDYAGWAKSEVPVILMGATMAWERWGWCIYHSLVCELSWEGYIPSPSSIRWEKKKKKFGAESKLSTTASVKALVVTLLILSTFVCLFTFSIECLATATSVYHSVRKHKRAWPSCRQLEPMLMAAKKKFRKKILRVAPTLGHVWVMMRVVRQLGMQLSRQIKRL